MPNGEEEKAKQQLMEKLLDEHYTAREYFKFPNEWEKNGTAEVVREAYGIKHIMEKHAGETYDFDKDDYNTISTRWTCAFYE